MVWHNKLNIVEIVFITVNAVVLGIFWWGYTFIFDLLAPFLRGLALEGILTGFWYMGGVFFAYIIRKPGSAIMGELIASVIEGAIAQWGLANTLLYGFIQGVVVELLFLSLAYKRWNLAVLCVGGGLSGVGAALLSAYFYQFYKFGLTYLIIEVIVTGISGIILAGFFSKFLADKLAKTGLLNQFKIAHDK